VNKRNFKVPFYVSLIFNVVLLAMLVIFVRASGAADNRPPIQQETIEPPAVSLTDMTEVSDAETSAADAGNVSESDAEGTTTTTVETTTVTTTTTTTSPQVMTTTSEIHTTTRKKTTTTKRTTTTVRTTASTTIATTTATTTKATTTKATTTAGVGDNDGDWSDGWF